MMLPLHVVREGRGPLVVLSHALGCDLHMWDGVAAALAPRWSVLRYDHRGHGASPAGGAAFTIDDLADDAAGVIAAHSQEPVHFVGLSMGGMTAQALAVRHPQAVRSITVANSAAWYDDAARAGWQQRIDTVRSQGVAAISAGAMERWFSEEFRTGSAGAGVVADLRRRLEACEPGAYAAACEAVRSIDYRESNRRIACPTLVIAGSRDMATPPQLSQDIATAIAGARLRSLDAAHLSAAERPQEFAALLTEFWESLPA